MNEIIDILMERDGMEFADALELYEDALQEVRYGEDPEEVLSYMFGLEPDFVITLINDL